MFFAEIIVYASFIYLGLGVLFAVWFVAFGVEKLDDAARGTGFGFRLIVFFGAAAFWILLARRIAKGAKRPTERNAHRQNDLEIRSGGLNSQAETNPKSDLPNPKSK